MLNTGCLSRMDILGRSVADENPRFPIPPEISDVKPGVGSLPTILANAITQYPDLEPAVHGLGMMISAADRVNNEGKSLAFWHDETLAIHLIGPVTHHLLSMPRLPQKHHRASCTVVLAEEIRLACLVLLSAVKARFSLNTSDLGPLQEKLRLLPDWDVGQMDTPLARLHLWAMITWNLSVQGSVDNGTAIRICRTMHALGISNCRAAVDSAKELAWIDAIEEDRAGQLAEELTAVHMSSGWSDLCAA